MNFTDHRWLLVLDIRRARILRCDLDPAAHRCRVREAATLESPFLPHDRGGRPAVSAARGSDFTNPDRDHDLMRDQFAGEVVRWTGLSAKALGFESLEVYASAEFIGALRKAGIGGLRVRINERHADLAPLTDGQLETHPQVTRLAMA